MEIREIAMGEIFPPGNIDRSGYDEDKMRTLAESIAAHGLIQPVGVVQLPSSHYQLVWGKRRYMACQMLGWQTITCKVVEADSKEQDDLILHENLHREELAPMDEARWLQGYMERHNVDITGCAIAAKCSESRVRQLLSLLAGDSRVSDALSAGKISKAQALSINRIKDVAGREQGLHWATHSGMAADVIDVWRQQREAGGVDQAITDEQFSAAVDLRYQVRNQVQCVLHKQYVGYDIAIFVAVCKSCWDAAISLIEWYQAQDPRPNITVRERDYPDQNYEHSGPTAEYTAFKPHF